MLPKLRHMCLTGNIFIPQSHLQPLCYLRPKRLISGQTQNTNFIHWHFFRGIQTGYPRNWLLAFRLADFPYFLGHLGIFSAWLWINPKYFTLVYTTFKGHVIITTWTWEYIHLITGFSPARQAWWFAETFGILPSQNETRFIGSLHVIIAKTR